MKIVNSTLYQVNTCYPVTNNNIVKSYSVSFNARTNYGIPAKLPDDLLAKTANIHKNIDFIQEFFSNYLTRPAASAKIRKNYPGLVTKRSPALIFKQETPGYTFEVLKSPTRPQMLYINENNPENKFDGIIIDGDKLVANYLENHPHMLPRYLKYMNSERLAKANPEKFINIAEEKVQKFTDYIKSVQKKEIRLKQEQEEKAKNKVKQDEIKKSSIINNINTKQITEHIQKLGKQDGEKAANIFFDNFKKEFFSDIQQNVTDIENKIKTFLNSISK